MNLSCALQPRLFPACYSVSSRKGDVVSSAACQRAQICEASFLSYKTKGNFCNVTLRSFFTRCPQASKRHILQASSFKVLAADIDESGTPDSKAVKLLIGQGMNRIAALEAYSKASQHAYWSKVTLSSNVEKVIDYLHSIEVSEEKLAELVGAHPVVLAYNVEERLKPTLDYLVSIGMEDVGQKLIDRPSLLGLDLDQLQRLVGYFEANDYTKEQVLEMVANNV